MPNVVVIAELRLVSKMIGFALNSSVLMLAADIACPTDRQLRVQDAETERFA